MGTYLGQIKIDDGDIAPIGTTLYGTCTDAASVAAKTATVTGFDKLIEGVTVHIKFTNSNTNLAPSLNINGTGAKYIYKLIRETNSSTFGLPIGARESTSWHPGSVVSLTYYKNKWLVNDHIDQTPIVAGVKGNAESSYRTGNVNLTSDNIGALSLNGGTITASSLNNGIVVTNDGSKYTKITPNNIYSYEQDSNNNYNLTLEPDCLTINEFRSNHSYYIDIVTPEYGGKWDIRRYSDGAQSWAGISSSLDETLTKMWSTRGVYGWTYQNSSHNNATSMVTINSAAGQTITSHGGVMLFHYFGVLKTSRNTSFIRLCIDDVLVTTPEACITSSTTPMKVDGVYACTLNAGTHNIKLKMAPQDSGTTATLMAYNTFGWSAIET